MTKGGGKVGVDGRKYIALLRVEDKQCRQMLSHRGERRTRPQEGFKISTALDPKKRQKSSFLPDRGVRFNFSALFHQATIRTVDVVLKEFLRTLTLNPLRLLYFPRGILEDE